MDNLITIQVTDEQLAALQCLAAESAEDANLLEQALAVPIPEVPVADKAPFECGYCGAQLETLFQAHACGRPPRPAEPQACEHPPGSDGDTHVVCEICKGIKWGRDCIAEGCINERLTGYHFCKGHWNGGIPLLPASCSHGVTGGCRECRGDYVPDPEPKPPPCNHPDYGLDGGYWVICETCGKRKWDPMPGPVQAGVGLPMPEPDVVVDPAVAQLQRAVKQAGERLAALEQQILGFATHGHIAALEELVFANHTDTEKRIAALEVDKRNAPWLEVWGSTTRLYSALTMAKALGLSYDYVREKLSDYLATDEPVEVAEPVDSDPSTWTTITPSYDLDT